MPAFAEYETEKWKWITAFDAGFYPDHFPAALEHYKPVIDGFREFASEAPSSTELLRAIQRKGKKLRIQFLRLFRRYVSPSTSVEMLKKTKDTDDICKAFGPLFRDIRLVRKNIAQPDYDLVIAALLYEHKDRGKFGYELTERFFHWFEKTFTGDEFQPLGPRRAGKDLQLRNFLCGYEHECPTDIIITHKEKPIVAGFARYDSDRGGSQEDDRTGGNRSKILEILQHKTLEGAPLKVFFLNDGPGLLLGSMWRDYGELERINRDRVLVCTLKMLDARLTRKWLLKH
jgi:hypothetical protein